MDPTNPYVSSQKYQKIVRNLQEKVTYVFQTQNKYHMVNQNNQIKVTKVVKKCKVHAQDSYAKKWLEKYYLKKMRLIKVFENIQAT